jgi:hypothetical protein
MKTLKCTFWCNVVVSLLLFNFGYSQSPIEIAKDELPSAIGTIWTTLNNTRENTILNVGSKGENQSWDFTQELEGIEIKQIVVPIDSTPNKNEFQKSNFVIKYEGGLLDLIYSDVFPQIKGDAYFYQQISDTAVYLMGTSFKSPSLSGFANFQPPNAILNFVPTRYNDEWISKSVFSITKDTTIFGISGQLVLAVNDSAYSIIDGWGKISLPMGQFDCLRMKSYVTMNEEVTFNGSILISKRSRIINYNWLAEHYGLVMRVASHTGEQDDNFTNARLYTRMNSFKSESTKIVKQNYPSAKKFDLLANYPNPFNPKTSIGYHIYNDGLVVLKIYNSLGQEIKCLVNEYQYNGYHESLWTGEDNFGIIVPSGIYYYRLNCYDDAKNQYSDVRKMILLK